LGGIVLKFGIGPIAADHSQLPRSSTAKSIGKQNLRMYLRFILLRIAIMKIDPRRLTAFQIQLDALIHEAKKAKDSEIDAALEKTRVALSKTSDLLKQRGLFLQIPHGYKTPRELEGRTNPKPKRKTDGRRTSR
jgi:hypothetical protein